MAKHKIKFRKVEGFSSGPEFADMEIKFDEYYAGDNKGDEIVRPVQTTDVIENIVAAMQDGTATWASQEEKEILADLLVELIRRRKGLL